MAAKSSCRKEKKKKSQFLRTRFIEIFLVDVLEEANGGYWKLILRLPVGIKFDSPLFLSAKSLPSLVRLDTVLQLLFDSELHQALMSNH